MNNKLLTALSMALLFTACGDDSTSSSESLESQIKKKDFISVGNSQNDCVLVNKQNFANFLEATLAIPRVINPNTLITMKREGIQSCENYNRTWDDISCAVINFEKPTEESCIIGFDFEK